MALVLLTGMIPTGGSGMLVHISVLFPTSGLVAPYLFWDYMSYPSAGWWSTSWASGSRVRRAVRGVFAACGAVLPPPSGGIGDMTGGRR
ncbi:MAG: hypothetical protein ACLT98_08715 [Eggerthellaceae bacterium]